ncbi:MAG TPA: NRDE family protein [Chitinophagaceae bacterium]|nr:NRDE family protein [Chitinophagaceae bacterium]
MCTVTFVPAKTGCFIASNRDEKHIRRAALPPQWYKHNCRIMYPKDTDAGGTWIAMKDNGDAAVLLNGAFIKHEAKPPYRKSRGLIFLDIVEEDAPVEAFKIIPLNNIEPFTLVFFVNNTLYECRWDGNRKYLRRLQGNMPHIWSSATLYDDEVIEKRRRWFDEWLRENPLPGKSDIIHFHRFGGDGDAQNDIRMSRGNMYCTVSITVMEITGAGNSMHYFDLKNNKSFTPQIDARSLAAV